MARLSSNLAANFAGAAWSAGVQLLCVPLFVRLMGVESYGLVGFFIMLQISLQVLDLGISATVNRELARYSALPERAAQARSFVRTLETGYWALGIALGAGIALLAPVIAAHWIQAGSLGVRAVRGAVALMGLAIAFQWPLSFYQGGLIGLQKLVPYNAIRVFSATLANGGALLILWRVSADVQAFFLWQAAAYLIQAALLATALWRGMPGHGLWPRPDFSLVRDVLPFAAGMSGIGALGTLLSQMDKVVLSRFLPLDAFGYYVLAGVLASSLQLFVTPVFSAVFPRMSAMSARGDTTGLCQLYHAGSQVMACLVLSSAVVLAVFARQFIGLWTGDPATAARVAPIAVLLLAGTAINGLMHLPYALQLACGWTALGLQLTLFKVVVFLPLLLCAAIRYGAIGGAATWALLNVFYLVAGLGLTHRRLLVGHLRRWVCVDVGAPLAAVLAVATAGRLLVPTQAAGLPAALWLAGVGLSALAAAACSAPDVRRGLLKFAAGWFAHDER